MCSINIALSPTSCTSSLDTGSGSLLRASAVLFVSPALHEMVYSYVAIINAHLSGHEAALLELLLSPNSPSNALMS